MPKATEKSLALRALRELPGVGASIAEDLWRLGFRTVADFKDQDPEEIYRRHCRQKGCRVDRCWLYVARGAVYFASHQRHHPEKLKWWNWKDTKPFNKKR